MTTLKLNLYINKLTLISFLRQINVPAYGVSPLKNLPILLHDHNEYVLEDTVLEGLEFYKILIPLVANEPAF
jgi:aminoacylase